MPISQYVEQFPQEMHMSFFTVMRNLPNFWMRPRIAAMGQPNRHQTRVPISGYMPTPITPAKMPPMAKPYHSWTLKATLAKSGCCRPMAQLTQTIAVVTRATKSTVWIETCSTFQARGDLLERWRKGSPAVLASPPQPQTHEQ